MQLRAAANDLPDSTFARRLAVATCVLTALAVGGAIGVALSKPAPAAAARASYETVRTSNLRFAQFELDDYVKTAFPRWAASRPTGACPPNLIEVNAYQPRLHVVDPFGVPYHYTCKQGVFTVHAAGPDGEYDTADDYTSQVP